METTAHAAAGTRIAVDIGGTFTDLVLVQAGRVTANAKVLTTPGDPSMAVENGIARLLDRGGPGDRQGGPPVNQGGPGDRQGGPPVNQGGPGDRRGGPPDNRVRPETVGEIVHGTTLVSNALIERKGATTALVTTRGFRDVLTIRRELRYDLYDLFLEMPEALVPRRLRFEVDERVLADGSVDRPLDAGEVRRLARRLERDGVQAVAVSLLHAYRQPGHERTVAEVLGQELPGVAVSLSSEVSPELGEFARTSTVVANAYVLPLVASYLEMLQKRLEQLGIRGPLRIMLSTGAGGLAGADTARRYPVRLLESGPAAGALAAGYWGAGGGNRDVLAFDMGGTTAKACLIEDGIPMVAREFEAARVYRFTKGSGLPLRVPVIDLIEIGAGGGSIARVGPFGLPKVGPDSTGADPGPACYGQGGTEPTVTDADLLLGYLNPDFFLGGEMRLDPAAARRAMTGLAGDLGLPVEEAAAAVHRVVNENMASAARMHAIERGRDLRRFTFVATGGAGPVHAWGVARALGIARLVFPPSAGVASAFGMLTAAPGFEFARSLPAPLGQTDWAEVRRAVAELVAAGRAQLGEAGVAAGDVRVDLAADVRHRGQGEAVTVALGEALGDDPAGQVEAAFEAVYTRLYGHRPPGVEAEVTTWRVRVMGPEPELDMAARGEWVTDAGKGRRPVWFAEADGFVETDVVDRYRLAPGAELRGPAVVEERESTMVIGPGGRARVDRFGNLEVELG